MIVFFMIVSCRTYRVEARRQQRRVKDVSAIGTKGSFKQE